MSGGYWKLLHLATTILLSPSPHEYSAPPVYPLTPSCGWLSTEDNAWRRRSCPAAAERQTLQRSPEHTLQHFVARLRQTARGGADVRGGDRQPHTPKGVPLMNSKTESH